MANLVGRVDDPQHQLDDPLDDRDDRSNSGLQEISSSQNSERDLSSRLQTFKVEQKSLKMFG